MQYTKALFTVTLKLSRTTAVQRIDWPQDKGSAENVTARKQIIVRNSPEEHKWVDF